ncbi:MAG: hypothetical protein WCK29_02660 [archaeon]
MIEKIESFKTREEVDKWYASSIEGIGRAMTLDAERNNGEITNTTRYGAAISDLNRIVSETYSYLRIVDEHQPISLMGLAQRLNPKI